MKTKPALTAGLILTVLSLLTGCGPGKEINLFEGAAAQDAMTGLSRKIGHPARALKVEITQLGLKVQVQDPAQPTHVDEYGYEHIYLLDGRLHHVILSGPTPVELNLSDSKLEENLFNLEDVNFAGVAATAQDAVRRVGIEGGAVTGITIQRHLFLIPVATCGDVEWNISLKSDRESATAYANAKGQITRLNLDQTTRAQSLDLFTDMPALQEIVGMMRDVFGSTPAIKKLHLANNYIWFDARDPKRPNRLMSFTANLNGVLMTMDAFGGGPDAPPLPDDRFFRVDDVDWSLVPDLLKQAHAKLGISGGRIYLITLQKEMTGDTVQPLQWDIELQDENEERGEIYFDAKGAVVRVQLPKSRAP